MNILLGILTFVLILVSVFLVLIVLAQKAKSDGGMGSALGGGAAEAAFGGETSNVLSKLTHYAAVIFFVLAFGLYLGRIAQRKANAGGEGALPSIPATAIPATTTVPAATPADAPAINVAPPAASTTVAPPPPAEPASAK